MPASDHMFVLPFRPLSFILVVQAIAMAEYTRKGRHMDIYEILDIFETEMKNEVFHHVTDDVLQDILLKSIEQAKNVAISTYEADKK